MEKRTKRNGFRLGILMLCTVMLLFAVMPTGVLADEDVKHNVTFNVTTTEGKTVEFYAMSAKVTDNQNNEYESVPGENGWESNVYALPDGEYNYNFSYSQKEGKSGTFTVNGAGMTIDVALETIYYPVRFSVTPEDAKVELYKNGWSGKYGDPIQPDGNGVYTIPFGQYRYIISADGYETVNKTFNATDTSLKNNNYVIKVSLKDMTDTILSDAYSAIFDFAGEDITLTEFSGNLYEPGDEFIPWSIDSDYQDVNVIDWVRAILDKSGDKFKNVTISVADVCLDSWYYDDASEDTDYSVINENGVINYYAVDSENYSEEAEGAAYEVSFELSMNGKTYDDTIEVTFIVPEHIFTRQERLEQTADDVMKGILGTNPSKDAVTDDLVLPRLLEDDDYGWYFIDSSWKSSDTSVIANDGTVTRPDYDKNVTLELRVFYAENFIDDDNSYLLDPGPLGDGETFRTITVTVKGTLGEKKPEPEPKPEPDPEPEEPDPLPIIMFNSLTFDTNGGTAVSTVRSMQWSTIDLSSYTTEKEGYVFTGWYLDAECTKPCDKVTMDRNITVYAGWEKIAEFPYTDVTADEWFFDDVRYVWDNGLIDGVTEDAFEPEANVTRAVLIEALWRGEGRPEAESAGLFTDVAEDNAFAGAIAWAKETGIANGYDDGRFGIDDVVTREQTAAFLYRYAQYKKMDVSVGEDTNILSFDDIDTASEYAIPSLCWACGADILRGDGNGCLRPADTVTRAELSAQLNRLIEAAR